MNAERFRKIKEIYHAVLEILPEERASFLANKCGEDSELKDEINKMLSFGDTSDSFLDIQLDELATELFSEKQYKQNLTGKKIGRYKVLKKLGEGGMGTVYLARDLRLARSVALKVLSAEMVQIESRVQRFKHEARAASALNHPHIMTIYEIDEFEDGNLEKIHYISMEFIDGKTFQDLIYREKTPAKSLLEYLAQAAAGLSKAHSAGIVHRDLKPENIMVTNDGYAKILDFGLAKLTDTENELHKMQQHRSRSGMILGTLGYMSPEQAQGKTGIDERSDIFSFGCILYEAVARRKAFQGETTIDALHKIIHSEPVPVTEFVPEIPFELKNIIEKCLQKNSDKRFPNTKDLAADLRKLLRKGFDEIKFPSLNDKQKTAIFEKGATYATAPGQFSEQRRQVTVMFADVSALSEILEDFDPEESSSILKDLWNFLDEVIIEGGGRVGERLTDTFIAIWGSNAAHENDPEKAARTAFELQHKVGKYFNKKLSGQIELSTIEKEEIEKRRFLKIGISTGTVLLGQSKGTGEFITSGAAVSIAKRLVSNAEIGDILASHDTYRHIRGIFEVDEIELKGRTLLKRKNQQTKVYSLKGIKPRAFRFESRGVEGIETQIIGREDELNKMLDALKAASEDEELQIVTVAGEAGLGKSRLLFEFQDRVELLPGKYFFFKARALETMHGLPFSLVRNLFSFRFEIQDGDSNAAAHEKLVRGIMDLTSDSSEKFGESEEAEMKAHFIGHLIGFDFSESPYIKKVADDEKQIRNRAMLYSAEFFSAVSKKFPVVFYLDDLHWADGESLEYFDFIARKCSKNAILITEFTRPVLFEKRPNWGEGRENGIRLNLQPLTKIESRKLIENILQKTDNIPKKFKDLIVSNADGNPFYVEELIKMFIEQKVINAKGEEWTVDIKRLGEISVPPTLTGVLQSRLDKLSHRERRVLQRASVIGREFWDKALKKFEQDVNVPTILESLRNKELLFRKENSIFDDTKEYIFKHAILRDVTYETILLKERRKWHTETAVWLIETGGERQNEYFATIAEHFEKANETERSAEWFGKAGDQALKSFASQTAVSYFRKALEYVQEGGVDLAQKKNILHWKRGLGKAFYNQAEFAESIENYSAMLEISESLNDKLSEADAYLQLSVSQFENGETATSLESAKLAVSIAENLNSGKKTRHILARSLYRQGRALASLGKFREAVFYAEQALKTAEDLSDEISSAKANNLHLLALSNMTLGNFKEAQKFEEKELEISRSSGDIRTVGNGLNSLGVMYFMLGDAEKSLAYYTEALEIAREIENRSGEIMVRSNIGGVKVCLGKYEEAEFELKNLIKEVGDKGHFLISEMYLFLTEALIGQGKFEEALETAKKTLQLAEEIETQETIGEAWLVLGAAAACLKDNIKIGEKNFSAENCFEKSLQIFKENALETNFAKALHIFAHYNLKTENTRKSRELFEKEEKITKRLDTNTEVKCKYFKNHTS